MTIQLLHCTTTKYLKTHNNNQMYINDMFTRNK